MVRRGRERPEQRAHRSGEGPGPRPRIGATLLVAKLDRLSRSVRFIATVLDAGVEFRACDIPHASRLMLHILSAVAEAEAATISQRTQAALSAARERGTLLAAENPACRSGTYFFAIATLAKSAAYRFARTIKVTRIDIERIADVKLFVAEGLQSIGQGSILPPIQLPIAPSPQGPPRP